MRTKTRETILREFRADPYRSVTELAAAVGVTPASVSGHLIKLEHEGLIKRPKLVYDTSRQASTPVQESQRWASVSKKGAIERGEGALKVRKARGEDALQKRIEKIVAEAEKGGTCFRADFIKLERLGGCKCG